ncbi:30S ribosomal protein S3 [Candidatus Woesearchaeota archaeon]|nr:30S ribosomal protein S3 [Candidatus Woesearchaeota archaeon]
MIEREIIKKKMNEFSVKEYISENLKRIGHSDTKVQRTPLGEKIIISASRPGLVVGRKGQSIKKLTLDLKKHFNMDNPQVELAEVDNVSLDPHIIAEKIQTSMESFGIARFKGLGHKIMTEVMGAGAKGIEILISGKVPSARAKRWRFYQGYLKKSGDVAMTKVRVAYAAAQLKSGTVGIQVRIMPPDVRMPDSIIHLSEQEIEDAAKSGISKEAKEKEEAGKTVEGAEENAPSAKDTKKKPETKEKKPRKRKVKTEEPKKEEKHEN